MTKLTTPTRSDDVARMHKVCAILEHCKKCPNNQTSVPSKTVDHEKHCGNCRYFRELRRHGGELWGADLPRKARKVLQKERSEVTAIDLQYLFDSGVSKERVATSYGFKKASTSPFKNFVLSRGVTEPTGKNRGN